MKIISVAAGIILRNDTYLIVDRPQGKTFAGLWEFPGGKIEKQESPENALVRELKEEINISISSFKFWKNINYTYNLDNYNNANFNEIIKPKNKLLQVNLFFYFVTAYTGEAISNEGQKLMWVNPLKALKLPFVEADQSIVKDLYFHIYESRPWHN